MGTECFSSGPIGRVRVGPPSIAAPTLLNLPEDIEEFRNIAGRTEPGCAPTTIFNVALFIGQPQEDLNNGHF